MYTLYVLIWYKIKLEKNIYIDEKLKIQVKTKPSNHKMCIFYKY